MLTHNQVHVEVGVITLSERGIALNKGEVVSRTRNCMVCVLIVVLSLLGCGQEVMPIDEGLQGNVKKEISEYIGYKNLTYMTRIFLKPLLDSNKLSYTIPEKPQSRLQKYITKQ